MIVENLIFLIVVAVGAVASFITAFVCGPQKAAVNVISGLVGLFLTGWLTLLLIVDAAVLPSAFTFPIVLFALGTMFQTLVCTFQPAPGVGVAGTVMAVAGVFLFQVATTQEYALAAMIATFFTLFGACAIVVLFGHKLSMVGLLVPTPFLLGGSAIAVAMYLSFVGSPLTVLVSLLLLGGLVFVQPVTGLIAGWNCDAVNMNGYTFVQMLFSEHKRPHGSHKKSYVLN